MNARTILGIVACALVALGVGLAFSEMGSPAHNRDVAIDARRERAIRDIASATVAHRDDYATSSSPTIPDDVASDDRAAISYEKRPHERFALCTVFRTAGNAYARYARPSLTWAHSAGRTCFEFDRYADRYEIAPLATGARSHGV